MPLSKIEEAIDDIKKKFPIFSKKLSPEGKPYVIIHSTKHSGAQQSYIGTFFFAYEMLLIINSISYVKINSRKSS